MTTSGRQIQGKHETVIYKCRRALTPARGVIASALLVVYVGALTSAPAQQANQPAPEFLNRGRQLAREGKLEEALTVYREELKTSPNSPEALNAAGVTLDLLGQTKAAREYFTRAIDSAPTPQAKANAQRQVMMSYGFDGDCQGTARFGQLVFDYQATQKDFYRQGEIANEVARICLESGDFDTAEKWYQKGYDAGMREPEIKADRVALWNFRREHALGRLAARRNRKEQAQKHVAAAKALLDGNAEMAKAQAVFFPYLEGYVAFYGGDYQKALTELQKANQDDPFIQCLIGQTYEKMGQKEKALEFYRQAAQTTAHNPVAAYARPFAMKKLKAAS